MNQEDRLLLEFLEPQLQAYGGKVEIEPGAWALFAVAASDVQANTIARNLLDEAGFPYETGESEDDQWVLYFVDQEHRATAIHWLDDSHKILTGQVRPPQAAHLALVDELIGSTMPHRVAQRIGELHNQSEVSAGFINDPTTVRALLDRLHNREPLFFAAIQTLLAHNLIDIVILLRQLIDEDVGLENELVKASLSKDPFLQSRQDAAVNIRNLLIRFHVINPMDQQKNTAIKNPYAEYMEVAHSAEEILASIDGTVVKLPRDKFINAIRTIRRNLYRGDKFEELNTQVPWMNDDIAYSFRFIRQRLDARREVSILDGLFMLERAVTE